MVKQTSEAGELRSYSKKASRKERGKTKNTPVRINRRIVRAGGNLAQTAVILENSEVQGTTTQAPSEYEVLRTKISPLLGDSSLVDLSAEKNKAISKQLKVPLSRVKELASSELLARETRLPPEMFFGLIRQGYSATLSGIFKKDPKQFQEVITRAIEANQIPRFVAAFPGAVDRLAALVIESTPIAVLMTKSVLKPSAELKSLLRTEGVETLADLRRTGGLSYREGLSDADRSVAANLDAHARLLTLYPDPVLTSDLIKNGYSSISAIAHAEPSELATAVGLKPDAPLIKELIDRGKAQHELVQSVSFGLMGSQATGIQTIDEWKSNHPIYDVVGESCSCKDCDAAVSPRAYLADLMQYAIDHLRDGGQAVDLTFFESHFFQPFGKLPANCLAVEEEIHQVRICIEVLRAYLGQRPLTDATRESALKTAEQQYRLGVYQVLLNKLGTNLVEMRSAQSAPLYERQQIADRIGIAEPALAGMYLDPTPNTGQLTEQALEREFGLNDTNQPPLRNIPIAIFMNARRYYLQETWKLQDWPIDEYFERKLPIIDPDILGPDDFRMPYRKTNVTNPERAFDLWVARREWADEFLRYLGAVPLRQAAGIGGRDFTAIVRATRNVPYRGHANRWSRNTLRHIQTELSGMKAENAEKTTQDLEASYHISLDAARRLIELWEKDSAFWKNTTRAPQLEETEWKEVFAILLRVQKNTLGNFWINEEINSAILRAQANEIRQVWSNTQDASQALFGMREFWKSVREPVEGEWPPLRTGNPLVDPEFVKLEELPEPIAGRKNQGLKDIRAVWEERTKELLNKHKDLARVLENSSFEAMLADALGTAPASATTWTNYLHKLDQDLAATNTSATTKQTIEGSLHLSIEGFQRLVNVMDSQIGLGGRPLPSEADLDSVLSLLVTAWKVRTRYSRWVNQETNATTGFEPWRCRRHTLARWRATVEERQQWQRAFTKRNRSPLIDPDLLVSVGYFTTPSTGAAWTLWDDRQKAIAAKFSSLQGVGRTLTGLNQLADVELGPGVLDEFAEDKKLGKAMNSRLQQVNLSYESLNELLQIRELLSQTPAQPVLDTEWDAVASLLTQVWKVRQFAEWQLEELAQDVYLSPDLFQLLPVDFTKFPPPLPPQLDEWRASKDVLLDWEDRLQSRIDQDSDIARAIEQAVSEAEEQALPALRDALISAAASQGFTFEQAKRWLGDYLAIATEYGGCDKTTRISQAIETFQGILWGVRTGILADQYPNLRLIGENFDEEWKWIGSYATWRAAIFVLLYPENILLPSLRRVQTPAFRELVDELRGVRQLTPERARQVAEQYAAYFRDVCSLTFKATCTTLTATPTGDRELQYLFAIGGESGTVYWCFYDWADQTGYPLSFWVPLKGLEGKPVTIVGVDSYQIFAKRYLYLFLIVESEGNRELAFLRFDLRNRTWDEESKPLKRPPDAGTFTAVLLERLDEKDPPVLAIRASDGTFYQRFLNETGMDWAGGEWIARDRIWSSWVSATSVNTDNQTTQDNACRLKAGSRFFAAQHATDSNIVHLACLGQDGQAYGFKLNGYINPNRLENFNVPNFSGILGSEGGIAGIARNALLPNSQTVMPQIDLFAVANDQRIFTAHWDLQNGWVPNQWTRLGNVIDKAAANSYVSVTARHPNDLDVLIAQPGFAISIPNEFPDFYDCYWKFWGKETGYVWRNVIAPIPSLFYGHPAVLTAFVPRPARFDIIFNLQTTDPSGIQPPPTDPSTLIHMINQPGGSAWTGGFEGGSPTIIPESKDVTPQAIVAVAVRTTNLFDIFVPRTQGAIWTAQRVIDGAWSKWAQIGERSATFTATAQISALTRSSNHVLIFATDDHGRTDINGVSFQYGMIQSSWQQDEINSNKWHPWTPVNFPPSVVFKPGGYVAPVMTLDPVFGKSVLHLFAIDLSGVLRWTESIEELPVRNLQIPSFYWKPALWSSTSLSDLRIVEQLTELQRLDRPIQVKAAYEENQYVSKSISAYLEEYFYFVPLQIALQLQKSDSYLAALDWFKLVYNFTAPLAFRELVGVAPAPSTTSDGFDRNVQNWLLDPLNPHSIAATRRNTYTRYTLMAIILCLLEYADSEFTQDTSETVPRARELYESSLKLLNFIDLKQGTSACEEVIGQLNITLQNATWQSVGSQIYQVLRNASSLSDLKVSVRKLNKEFSHAITDEEKYQAIRPILDKITNANTKPLSYSVRLMNAKEKALRLESAVLARPDISTGLQATIGRLDETALSKFQFSSNVTMDGGVPIAGSAMPSTLTFDFCVPANPVLKALRLRAELNLYKINKCRNIAGLERQLESYAAPTDTVSGMPVIGSGGQLTLPGIRQLQVTVYRYGFLIERAKQLVQQAMQIEAAFLTALEKSDKEAYDLLTARANVRFAQAGVRLQDLRILEAKDGVKAAELQRDRAQIQVKTYEDWINQGLTPAELALLGWYDWLAGFQITSILAEGGIQALTAMSSLTIYGTYFGVARAIFDAANASRVASQSLAANAQREISRLSLMISFERRMEELTLQKAVADQDVLIGEQQIMLTNDRVRITEQELVIEQLKADQAKEVLDFLSNKFTNKELYDWMSNVLEGVYSVLLQQATNMAKLASDQLAFERQEPSPSYIQDDYWMPPADNSSLPGAEGQLPDRRGLTGSARLLQDISQLDQYAFETNQRKQQLSMTISLAQHDPLAFQRFIETGVLPFVTPMDLFDRDFPGHYLRLIKRVRTSVIALIPPTHGIRATLTASGLSRVVIGGDLFQTITVRRPPEVVSLSSPANASGLFELQEQPEVLLPFEDQGVSTSWEFVLPKAANLFDFSTIADVLVTIDYTALSSFDYKQQVVQILNSRRTVSQDRAFSFRYQFADAWYDLHNPELTSRPMSVEFETVREDFPPNLDNVRIEQVTLYFSRKPGRNIEFETVDLRLVQSGGGILGGTTRTDNGVISTRAGNGASWLGIRDSTPFGPWHLTLPNTEQVRQWFEDGDVNDILLIITYAGRLPEWPI